MLSDIYFAPGLLQPVQREERGIPKIHLHSPQPNKWTNEYTRIHVQYIALPSHASMVLTVQKLCDEPILTGSGSDFSIRLNTDLTKQS